MYTKILVPVDGSATSMLGLSEAIKLAKIHGSQLQLVHVVNELVLTAGEGAALYVGEIVANLRAGGKALLAKAEGIARERGCESQSVLLESIGGRAADLIVEQATRWKADLIVMGTHGRRGLSRLALGSDAELVVRAASVPVLLIREHA